MLEVARQQRQEITERQARGSGRDRHAGTLMFSDRAVLLSVVMRLLRVIDDVTPANGKEKS